MRIAHVTNSISRLNAGISKAVSDLAEVQANSADSIHIFTLMDQFTHIDQPKHVGISVSACPVTFSHHFGYSLPLKKSLSEHAGSIDVIHMHGLWMYPNRAAGNIARKLAIPYIMSPHGMLEPWGLDRSRWKKKVAGLLFEYKNLTYAACLHACSEQEASNLRRFGYKGPIALVPLGLTREEYNVASFSASEHAIDIQQQRHFADKRILLFLSRLHVKKGLELLFDAWKLIRADFPDWHLVVAGDGELAYVAELQRKVCEAGLANSVTFTGSVHGDDKWRLLRKADIFVLPTYSENFGLVVAEALASGVPVITTKGAPWGELETEACGWWIDIGMRPLEECLVKAMALSANQLALMGQNGRLLVESRYVIDVTARTMRSVYAWIINGGPVPACVRLD